MSTETEEYFQGCKDIANLIEIELDKLLKDSPIFSRDAILDCKNAVHLVESMMLSADVPTST